MTDRSVPQKSKFIKKTMEALGLKGSATYRDVINKLAISKKYDINEYYISNNTYDIEESITDEDEEGEESNTQAQFINIMSLNINGMNKKFANGDVDDLWAFVHKHNVSGLGIQEHNLVTKKDKNIKKSLKFGIPGYEHCRVTVAAGQKGEKRTAVGGSALALGGALAKYTAEQEIADKRKWGRYCGRKMIGPNSNKIVILSLYAPVISQKPGSMWSRQLTGMQGIPAAKRGRDPLDQCLKDIGEVIGDLQGQGYKIIVMGDMNVNILKDDNKRKMMYTWASKLGLLNPYIEACGGQGQEIQQEQITHTWIKGKGDKKQQSIIDYFWVTGSLISNGVVKATAISTEQIAHSDHRPVLLQLDAGRMLGINKNADADMIVPPERRVFKFANKKHLKQYTEELDKEWEKRKLHEKISSLLRQVRKGRDWVKRNEQQTQTLMDDVLQHSVESMLEAEAAIDTKHDGHKHHGWSPMYIHKLNAMRKCKGLLTRAKKGKKWEIEFLVRILNNRYKWLHIPPPPAINDGTAQWLEWRGRAEKHVKKQKKALHYKSRVRMRCAVSKYAQRIERSRKKSETSRLFYTHISDVEFQPPATEIFHQGKWHEGEKQIKELEKENVKQHMWGTENTFHQPRTSIRPNVIAAGTAEGKKLRQRIADGESGWESNVPEELRPFFRHGKRLVQPEAYKDIFTSDISYESFENYLSSKTNNKSGGENQIRVDHIKGGSEGMKRDICTILSIPYLTHLTYAAWNTEIINWIPKEPGNSALDRRRPIALLDVMRKLSLGAKKTEVFKVWEEHGLIQKDNYAFMRGKAISEAILIKRMLLEDARVNNKPIYTLDIDYKAAFDKVTYFIKEMALRRMGLPEEGIDLWCRHDTTRRQKVRTAFGLTDPVHPRAGAFGQGAEESPMGFTCLMSWKCDYIDAETAQINAPVGYKCEIGPDASVEIMKTLFCDDSSYISNTIEGTQILATLVGLFAAATGMMLNLKKSFWICMNGKRRRRNQMKVVTVPVPVIDEEKNKQGEIVFERPIKSIQLREGTNKEYWRHLGNYQNNLGGTQMAIKEVRKAIDNDLQYMVQRKITPEAALQGYNTKIKMKIIYILKHNSITATQAHDLQTRINVLLKPKLKLVKNLPAGLLHGHKNGGGLQISHLWDEINIEKMNILRSILSQRGTDAHHIFKGAIYNLQKISCSAAPVLMTKWNKMMGLDASLWLTSLWQWMSEHDQILDTKYSVTVPRGDECIIDRYIEYVESRLDAEETEMLSRRQHYRRATKPPVELMGWQYKITRLRKGLWGHRITTMSQLTQGRKKGLARIKYKYDVSSRASGIARSDNIWVNDLKDSGLLDTQLRWAGNRNSSIQEAGLAITIEDTMPMMQYIKQELEQDCLGNEHTVMRANKLKNTPDKLLENGECYAYTDGSMKGNRMSSAWIITDAESTDVLLDGGGRTSYKKEIDYENNTVQFNTKPSSTRAEAQALMQLHMIVNKILNPDIHINVGIDSMSTITTYHRLHRMTALQRVNLPNWDMWNIIYEYKMAWGMMNLYHVPSHMDDYMELEELTAEWLGNVYADSYADDAYHDGAEIIAAELAVASYGVVYHQTDKTEPVTMAYTAWARELVQHHATIDYLHDHPIMAKGIDWRNTIHVKKAITTYYQRLSAMKLMWNLYAYGHVKLLRKHANPREAMCAWCGKHAETQDHVLTCKNERMNELHKQVYEKMVDIITEHLPEESAKIWIKEAVPAILSGGAVSIAETIDVRLNKLTAELKDWPAADMWKGVVPQQLIRLLRELRVTRNKVSYVARQITILLEHAATDIWLLTNAIKQKALPVEAPTCSQVVKISRLHTSGKLGYTLQQFVKFHTAHQNNIIKRRQTAMHGEDNADIAVLAQGQTLREYRKRDQRLHAENKTIRTVGEGEYILEESDPMEGVQKRVAANALQDAVDSDGFTRLERGMIDRELFPKLPKKSRARRKYVRRIRKRRELVVCDLVADDAKTLTMPLHTLLHTHTVGDPIPAGRARGHRLPEDIAQKLQALALTTKIEKTIRGAIPPSKLKRLERRIAERKGPGRESRKNKSSAGTRGRDSLEEHSGYARSDMNVGDQDQGPKSRGGGAKGKAEGGEGRGSRVPRRGFSK